MRDKRIICDRKKLYKSGKLLVTAGIFSAVIFGVSTTNVSADSTNNTGVTVSQATDKVADTTATTDKVADTAAATDKVAETIDQNEKIAYSTAKPDKPNKKYTANDEVQE